MQSTETENNENKRERTKEQRHKQKREKKEGFEKDYEMAGKKDLQERRVFGTLWFRFEKDCK